MSGEIIDTREGKRHCRAEEGYGAGGPSWCYASLPMHHGSTQTTQLPSTRWQQRWRAGRGADQRAELEEPLMCSHVRPVRGTHLPCPALPTVSCPGCTASVAVTNTCLKRHLPHLVKKNTNNLIQHALFFWVWNSRKTQFSILFANWATLTLNYTEEIHYNIQP